MTVKKVVEILGEKVKGDGLLLCQDNFVPKICMIYMKCRHLSILLKYYKFVHIVINALLNWQ